MIEVPRFLAHLPRDRRGYPVPASVYIDPHGKPHFTINDEMVRQLLIFRDRCQICGNKLNRLKAWVGGAGSAFHQHGVYIDAATHIRCARFALKTCPYLAAPSYARRIDARIRTTGVVDSLILVDPTMDPDRPDPFIMVVSTGWQNVMRGPMVRYQKPDRPYARVERWRDGRRLP